MKQKQIDKLDLYGIEKHDKASEQQRKDALKNYIEYQLSSKVTWEEINRAVENLNDRFKQYIFLSSLRKGAGGIAHNSAMSKARIRRLLLSSLQQIVGFIKGYREAKREAEGVEKTFKLQVLRDRLSLKERKRK